MAEVKFRMRAKAFMLTYKTHIAKQELLEHILSKFRKPEGLYVQVAHETGSTGYVHTHAWCYRAKQFDVKSERLFDKDGIHPNMSPMMSHEHMVNQSVYCEKEDEDTLEFGDRPVIEDPMDWPLAIKTIEAHETYGAVIRDVRLMQWCNGKMQWVRDVWSSKEKRMEAPEVLRPHQEEWLRRLDAQDNRKVLWVVDEDGGMGKTVMGKYLIKNRGAFWCDGGKYADIVCAYDGQAYAVFDFKRSMESETWSYKAIEAFKDGVMFSGKYQSCAKVAPSNIKVIAFSNERPDKTKLSRDRWELLEYVDGMMTENPMGQYDIPIPLSQGVP